VGYREFVAPGMLAVAAMNASVLDTTFSFFIKYKYLGTYDTMLATPLTVTELSLGEVLFGQLRSGLYGAAFLVTMAVMGLIPSAWGLLAMPGVLLIGFAFAGLGLASTTFMRSFIDFDYVNLALAPMFLLSATFFPLERYPDVVETIVRLTPLYQGVALERALTLGAVDWGLLWHVLYLLSMGAGGLWLAVRRLRPLLQP
jgi:lipooligosaccharide transport system permease protein